MAVTTTGQITITDLMDGLNARLSNNSHVLAADATGVVSSFVGCATTMTVFLGSLNDTVNWTFTATPSANLTGSLSGNTYTVTALSVDTGFVDITAVKLGQPSLTARFSVAKAREGDTGENGLNTATIFLYARNNSTSAPSLTSEWNVSTANYTQSFSVSTQETVPSGVFFKPDGLKMYVVGASSDSVHEYNLSTAWSVSTAVLLQSFSVAGQDGGPQEIFFSPNGLKMYILGSATRQVHEYNLSTAWNVSTASYLQNFLVSSQELTPTGLFFKPDGLKMYVIGGSSDRVHEYNLSAAWNVSTAVFLQNFSVAGQDAIPQAVFFSTDGLKMYVLGTADRVHEYNLSTAWSVSTASILQNFLASAQDTSPTGLFFKPDGLKMYVVGSSSDSVHEYTLSNTYSYTFSTKSITGILTGWNTNIPPESDGNGIWVSKAVASSATDVDIINASEWSTPQVLAKKGDAGTNGTSPISYEVLVNAPVIVRSTSNVLSPASIVLNAFSTTGATKTAYSGRFKIYEDSVLKYTSAANLATYTYTPTTFNISVLKVELYLAGGTTTLLDTQEIPVVVAGSSGMTVSVSNGSHLIPADNSGAVAAYTGSGTTIQVFEGSTALTYLTTLGTTTSAFTIGTPTLSVASSITVGARSGSGTTTATVAQHSSMSNSVDSVVISYQITYNRANGAQAIQTVTQSITKAKAGTLGIRGSRQVYSTDVAYTSTYDFDGGGAVAAGAASYAAKATSLIATVTAGSTPTTPINGDTVTFSNGSNYVYTITHNGTSWVPPGTIIDGSLLVTGSVTASKINATGLEVRSPSGELLLGSGGPVTSLSGNMLRSSGFEDGAAGYIVGYYTTSTVPLIGWNHDSNYSLSGAGLVHTRVEGAVGVNQVFDFRDNVATPVTPNTRYEASVLLNAHRCAGQIVVAWLDGTQNYITEGGGNQVTYASEVWNLTDLRQSGGFFTSPSNAVFAFVVVRGVTNGQADPYLFIKNIYFGVAGANQEKYSDYSPGRSIGQITSANASTYIANAAIGSAQIGSIALTGTSNFSVKSATAGARMEMDSRVIKIFGPGPNGTTILRVQLGDLTL